MQSGERLAWTWFFSATGGVLSFLSSHTSLRIWDKQNNNQHNPSFSHWLSCYLLSWQVGARIESRQIFGKEWECKVRISYNIVLLCQDVYLQQVWLIFCVTATHLPDDGKACNPGLFVIQTELQNPGYFNNDPFSIEGAGKVIKSPKLSKQLLLRREHV